MFRTAAILAATAALAFALPALAQPIPPEFQVNLTIVGDQHTPIIDSNAAGDYVVGYMSEGTMMVRSFGSISGEFPLPENPEGPDNLRDIALGPSGFGVTFDRTYLGGVSYGAVARFYSYIGQPVSPEISLLAPGAAIAATDSGFVIVYRVFAGQPSYPELTDLMARRYRTDGTPAGEPFLVGAERLDEGSVSAAALPDGGFVAAWAPNDFGDNWAVYVRAFAADNTPSGDPVLVASPPTWPYPAVDMDDTGAFAVVWREGNTHNASAMTMARRYDAGANPIGDAFRVDDGVQAYYGQHALSLSGGGVLTVTWVPSFLENGYHNPNVYARLYSAAGALGPAFPVNVRTADFQGEPGATSLPNGDLVIVWESHGQDGSGAGIFGRTFGGATPTKAVTFGGLKALFEKK